MNTIIEIPFMGETLPIIKTQEGRHFIALRPICESIGVDWSSQHRKLEKQLFFNCGQMTTTGKDGKKYEMTVIPVNRFAAWLMTVNSWFPEVNRKLDVYKEQAADVLDAWLFQKPSYSRGSSLPMNQQVLTILRPPIAMAVKYYWRGFATAEIAKMLDRSRRQVRVYLALAEELGLIQPTPQRQKARETIGRLGNGKQNRKHLTLVGV